jgi:integrase
MRITKKVVDALKLPAGRQAWVSDSELHGFGVIVFPTGAKVFVVRYGGRGRRRTVTLGKFGPLTVEQARERAKVLLGRVAGGEDPVGVRRAETPPTTFGDWVDRYLKDVEQRKRSARIDRAFLEFTAQRWGKRSLNEITAEDVRNLFEVVRIGGVTSPESIVKGEKGRKVQERAKARQGKGTMKNTTANRWLASLRACLNQAWRLDYLESNPAMKVKLLPENPPRNRVLSDDEMKSVLAAVAGLKDPFARAAFILLIETGARSSEVLRARWEDLDLGERLWRLPRTKAGRVQVRTLAESTVAMLKGLKRPGPWVIPGSDPSEPRSGLVTAWESIQKQANIPDVHIHDIRRTFGLAATRLYGVHVASKLLGHSSVTVTEQVYAPLGIDELKSAVEGISRARHEVLEKKRKGSRARRAISEKANKRK